MNEKLSLKAEFDPEKRKQAKIYSKSKKNIQIPNLILSLLGMIILTYGGFTDIITDFGINDYYLNSIFFVVILLLLSFLFDLPFSIYGYRVEKRFELSVQSIKSWIIDQLKGALLLLILGLILIITMLFSLKEFPDTWYLIFWLFFLLFFLILMVISPMIISLFLKLETMPEELPIRNKLLELANSIGAKVKDVYFIKFAEKTTKVNAAVMGLGATRKIVIGDTMIDNFNDEEILNVMGHELSHHTKKDIWRFFILNSVITFIVLYLLDAILNFHISNELVISSKAEIASILLIVLWYSIISLFTGLITNYYSRRRERICDRFALEIVKQPEAFASAFRKLADQNLAELTAHPLYVAFFYDHPTIKERLELCNNYIES